MLYGVKRHNKVVECSNGHRAAIYGIYGASDSTGAGYGVYGTITGHGNTGYAGYFINTDTSTNANYGVYGSHSAARQCSAGVYGHNADAATVYSADYGNEHYGNRCPGIASVPAATTCGVWRHNITHRYRLRR